MTEEESDIKKEKEPNFIIIAKQGTSTTKNNNRSYLTLKEGDLSLKMNLNASIDTKINHQKIMKTLSSIKKQMKNMKQKNREAGYRNLLINENQDSKNLCLNDIKEKEKKKWGGGEDTQVNININNHKELSSIIIEDDKMTENYNENMKKIEIESNFVTNFNDKSIRTQLNKKEKQKSVQQSDKAEISKVNSESDNVTELDNKLKNIMKFRYDSGYLVKGDINEKEEIENELIDNEKDLITVYKDNDKNENNKKENEERIIFKQDTIKKNNFIEGKENTNDKNKEKENNISNNKDSNKNKDNNKNDLIDISKDNDKICKDKDIGSDIDETVNEHNNAKSIPIMPYFRNKTHNQDLEKKDKKIEQNIKNKPISIIRKKIQNNINPQSSTRELLKSVKTVKSEKHESTSFFYRTMQLIQKNCFICEKQFYLNKLLCADCGLHFLCRKCLKNYYEDYIESQNTIILKCPCNKCDKLINYEIIKSIISEGHQHMYESKIKSNDNKYNNNDMIFNSVNYNSKNNENSIKMYSEKHVLDVNSNMTFFMFKKSKDIFCPKCLNPNLFSKTGNHFIKCLNCNNKICKYCLKEYTSMHLNLRLEGYCKVYFRRESENLEDKNYVLIFLLQLLFVIAMYVFVYSGAYLFFYDTLKEKWKLNDKRKNCVFYLKKIIIFLISIMLIAICFPIFIVFYPFFPSIIALFDY